MTRTQKLLTAAKLVNKRLKNRTCQHRRHERNKRGICISRSTANGE